jgi:hypothetical protein
MPTPSYQSLKAKEAGAYLSTLLGLSKVLSAQSMWRLACLKKIPHKRVARQILFRTDWLECYAAQDDSGLMVACPQENRL